jgi:N-6 DNA Methylase
MTLSLGDDVLFQGPALPEAFVRHELEKLLGTHLPKPRAVQEQWEKFRKSLRQPLTLQSGRWRVKNIVLDPLLASLGYEAQPAGDPVRTREGPEGPGLLWGRDTVRIRAFPCDFQADLDAPAEKGLTYRHTPQRIAERILLATGERAGLLTNGDELRLLLSDPARPVSFVSFRLNAWRNLSPREVPDGFRLLLAFLDLKLLGRQGDNQEKPSKLEALLDAARLKQGQITKDLRLQARRAVEQFIQGVLDHPRNRERLLALSGEQRERLPRQLWREALILVYRLLFILRGEASGAFRFGTTSPWRHTYSPGYALAEVARQVIDKGAATGTYLEQGLRKLFLIFEKGLRWTEANIAPLGGRLFGQEETPLLTDAAWSEIGCARLLDKLLWTLDKARGARRVQTEAGRRRINYADLDVEDLGRVYEALLELEPGLATEPMVRLRRAKLEVVLPAAQGTKYRPARPTESGEVEPEDTEEAEPTDADEGEDESSAKKSKIEFVEDIVPEPGSPGKFFLRVGLGRKSSGSYYTPDSFVRFLVQETLRPQVEERSPVNDPQPGEILKLKVLDPAMGSGHFLVGACRFLGERLYEACRLCADKGLWDRIPAEMAPYLPGRVQEGEAEVGVSADRARAICKRLVAVHCLYGVDKNELAVELAKVCLWLESQAEGMPLTFLDHRLVHGDSLTGPFWNHLITYPIGGGPVEGLFAQGVQEKFSKRLGSVLTKVRWLEQNVGATQDEIAEKQKLKGEIDAELFPFRVLALTWSGGVMLGEDESDILGYSQLLKHISEKGEIPETLERPVLVMLRRGMEMERLPAALQGLYQALITSCGGATSGPALSYDLTFPEVFYPTGVFFDRQGFHAVLGNPPWDRMLPADKEFFASYDFDVMNAPTKREREAIQERLMSVPEIAKEHLSYIDGFRADERIIDRLYHYQQVEIKGEVTIGKQDAFRVFMERKTQLVRQGGYVGVVVPSAFHANEGATGLRQLYLTKMALIHCYSFENRRQLFEIHRSFKFANVVARRDPAGTKEFQSAFYLHDDKWLFSEDRGERSPLRYQLEFVRRTGGAHLSFLELRSKMDLEVAELCFATCKPFGEMCERRGIRLGRELNMTDDAFRFEPTSGVLAGGNDSRDPETASRLQDEGYCFLHEGKTFRQYDDHWAEPPRYLVPVYQLRDKPNWIMCARFYRVAHREIAGTGDQNVSIWSMLTPGCVCGNTALTEHTPGNRPTAIALGLLGVSNSITFDWLLTQRVRAHVNAFIRDSFPAPGPLMLSPLISHAALRLTCNHGGYHPLWREQLGGTWREPKPPFTWPVLATDDERWEVRAAIDVVVADAYGLNREQYAHVLSSFSHKSYPKAPTLCLAKFDELKQIGLDLFTKKYDPYWDIPLNESLPKPVIDLPIPAEQGTLFSADGDGRSARPGRKKRG